MVGPLVLSYMESLIRDGKDEYSWRIAGTPDSRVEKAARNTNPFRSPIKVEDNFYIFSNPWFRKPKMYRLGLVGEQTETSTGIIVYPATTAYLSLGDDNERRVPYEIRRHRLAFVFNGLVAYKSLEQQGGRGKITLADGKTLVGKLFAPADDVDFTNS